jgi:large subunit ribosomal protein L23
MRDPREVIVRPLITEKSTMSQAEENQYTFEVLRDAGKTEIKQAIEALFNVHVLKVRTAQQRGKWRRRGAHLGKRPNWKKAIVKLAEGETIEVFEGL